MHDVVTDGVLDQVAGESFQQTLGSVNSTTHRLPLVIHGVDMYTFGANAITFKWQFRCVYSSLTDARITLQMAQGKPVEDEARD